MDVRRLGGVRSVPSPGCGKHRVQDLLAVVTEMRQVDDRLALATGSSRLPGEGAAQRRRHTAVGVVAGEPATAGARRLASRSCSSPPETSSSTKGLASRAAFSPVGRSWRSSRHDHRRVHHTMSARPGSATPPATADEVTDPSLCPHDRISSTFCRAPYCPVRPADTVCAGRRAGRAEQSGQQKRG